MNTQREGLPPTLGDLDGRYRAVFDAVALPVLVLDRESWRIVAANDAALAQYGYERDEFLWMNVVEVRPPEGREEARSILGEMPHGYWKTTAVTHCRKDGSTFRADVWSRDTELDGHPVRVCTISDVTARVRIQAELVRAQRMESVSRLAGGLAHDFNNALTSIIISAELLVEELERAGLPTEGIDPIWREADRLATLTGRLLAFGRGQPLRPVELPIARAVEEAAPALVEALGGAIRLTLATDGEAGSVRIDPAHFRQVLLTLAENARDAMPEGGRFRVETHARAFTSERVVGDLTIPAGSWVETLVVDTGPGMDEETRARAFEPFFTTKPPPVGTGLGLSMAYGVVRQHGGFITVESEPGKGCAFHILLPRTDAEGGAPPDPPPTPGRGVALLAVADEEVRRTTRRALAAFGFAAIEPGPGETAVELAAILGNTPALLVLDGSDRRSAGREEVDGLLEAMPELRVLLLAGYTDETAWASRPLGPRMLLAPKPLSMESLAEAIRTLFAPYPGAL